MAAAKPKTTKRQVTAPEAPRPTKRKPYAIAAHNRAMALAAGPSGMVKALPAKPTNSRMAKAIAGQAIEVELAKQAEADLRDPVAAKKRKAKEALELAKHEALRAKVPRAEFIPAYAEQICERMAEGEELGVVLKELGVTFGSMCQWIRKVPAFGAAFAIARENQAHLYISQITRIADNATGKGELARLQVDTRKWLASKILNKIYGDKVTVAGDEQNPLVTKLVVGGDDLAAKIKGGEV